VGQNGVLEVRAADGTLQKTLPVLAGYITALAWNDNGTTLYSGGQGNGLTAWDVVAGTASVNLTDTVFPVRAVAAGPQSQLAAAMGDNTLRTFGASGTELQRWLQQAAALEFVDAQTLMSGGADGFIRRMDPGGGAGRGEFSAHLGGVVALAVGGGRVASVGYDGVLRLSTVGGEEVQSWNLGGTLLNVALLADGRVAVGTAEGDLVVAAPGNNTVGRENLGSAVTALCAYGQTLWAGTQDAHLLRFTLGN
jgi:WD40 repeat protein